MHVRNRQKSFLSANTWLERIAAETSLLFGQTKEVLLRVPHYQSTCSSIDCFNDWIAGCTVLGNYYQGIHFCKHKIHSYVNTVVCMCYEAPECVVVVGGVFFAACIALYIWLSCFFLSFVQPVNQTQPGMKLTLNKSHPLVKSKHILFN